MVCSLATPNRFWFGDDDQRVDILVKLLDAVLRDPHALGAFEVERLGHDADRQDAMLPRRAGDHRRCAGSGAAAHAGGNEHHVVPFEVALDVVESFLRGHLADIGAGAGAEPLGDVDAEAHPILAQRLEEGLRVGVGDDEVDAPPALRRSCC